eukprot:2687884-Rhodomonas_salina.1
MCLLAAPQCFQTRPWPEFGRTYIEGQGARAQQGAGSRESSGGIARLQVDAKAVAACNGQGVDEAILSTAGATIHVLRKSRVTGGATNGHRKTIKPLRKDLDVETIEIVDIAEGVSRDHPQFGSEISDVYGSISSRLRRLES